MDNETKQKERNRLHKLYCERDKEFEAAKGKRTILTILGFTVFYFCVLYFTEAPTGWELIGALLVALIMAVFHFYINALIFTYLVDKGHDENEVLKQIEKKISELE